MRAFENVLLVGHSRERPSTSEFAEFIEATVRMHAVHGDRLRGLVLTDGGSPDETQRQALAARLDVSSVPVAVISGAARVRFVVSAFSFLHHTIQSFAPSELEGAMRHLGLSPGHLPRVGALAVGIRAELGELRVVDAMLEERSKRSSA